MSPRYDENAISILEALGLTSALVTIYIAIIQFLHEGNYFSLFGMILFFILLSIFIAYTQNFFQIQTILLTFIRKKILSISNEDIINGFAILKKYCKNPMSSDTDSIQLLCDEMNINKYKGKIIYSIIKYDEWGGIK
jgi:hypothetical protein